MYVVTVVCGHNFVVHLILKVADGPFLDAQVKPVNRGGPRRSSALLAMHSWPFQHGLGTQVWSGPLKA